MKRFQTILAAIIFLVMAVVTGDPAITYAVVFTPPGPGSTNPAVQPDGILVPDVFGSTPNWALSPPLRKFVDTLAPLGCASSNNLGQCMPVAVPDRLTFSGSDYYEIELRRYTEKMHTDLPPTTLQGYVQVNNGTNQAGTGNNVAPAPIHYLGPIIVAQKDRPVRIKFINKLPLEKDGNRFFLPVDTTVMGAGMGPLKVDGTSCADPMDPTMLGPDCAGYTQNRATLHLHGGLTPWISDGTPHQWTAPAAEATPYKKGASVQSVPDMWFDAAGNVIAGCAGQTTCAASGATNNPGDGALTFYYTNQQSARLMFYHDHAYGLTRLNVYAGEAAGYLIQDTTENDLITRNIIPADQIPLIIQDKAFVDAGTIGTLDPTWVWGTGPVTTNPTSGIKSAPPNTGDLWWPHVYMPAENPYDLGGVNPMGRWVYGPWFWPPTTNIKYPPIANPYYDCGLDGLCNSPWEPPTMPAPPNPSWVGEAFVDTMMVNGTVFPKLTVDPKAYRFRILNAAHDRFVNLQLYVADANVDPNAVNPACTALKPCAVNTEVRMVPAIKYPAFPDWDECADQREGGVPDPATAGPPWIQIGTEGGFLPAPAVRPNKPISYVMDPTMFNVGNVNDGTIILGPAERADVILDFSQYAGKTLILYNDAPAAFPAFVGNNDYYTGAPDMSPAGGHPGPKAGIGPNTRTIMQIQVAAAPAAQPFNLAALMDEFASTPAKDGVFKRSQEPLIVGQSAYNSAYNTIFPQIAPYWGIANISDHFMSFNTLNAAAGTQEAVTAYPMQPKAIHDEMGAVYDEYGRMSAKLGIELPVTNNINQTFVMQNYIDPPTELIQDGKAQIWKITHNGVDTHPIHFHLFDVQLINRVGWDGFIRLPADNELGWKDTIRISPLEDTIVALRPRAPVVPFVLPDSVRLLNPVMPVGATDGFMNLDPLTAQPIVTTNISHNFGAEYVWHCHILSHEEQDMMRSMVFRVATAAPNAPTALTVTPSFQRNTLTWTDNSFQVTAAPFNTTLGFRIERCNGTCNATTGTFTALAKMTLLPSAAPTYVDKTVSSGATYTYRVIAYNRYIDNAANWFDGISAPAYSGAVVSATWQPATGVALIADFASPHEAPVKFSALGSGATVPYQYRFWLDGVMVQDYSATRFWVMPLGTTPGPHTVTVDVRTNFATATPDTSSSLPYTILATVDSTPPVTEAFPPAGAFTNPVTVYLTVNEAGSTTKYTIDGSNPATSPTAAIYTVPINISATTTLKYYSTDPAGNAELVSSGIYELRPPNIAANVKINGGAGVTNNTAVTLTITATGATKMRFSNDNITYSADEIFAAGKAWTLAPATPDGPRSVYVRFTDATGILQDPVIAQITLDTTAPVTTAGPAAGTFITPVSVTLTASETGSIIRYTTDGSNPTTSVTATICTGPINIAATTALMYYATDPAGNAEAVRTSIYTIHTADLTVNAFKINGGATITNSTAVALTISAVDATGVAKMRFSNDGITYSADEPYATGKAWTLAAGDGIKSVYVRFTDGAGLLYDPVITQIRLDTTAAVTTAIPQAGTFINPLNVFLSANEAGSTIKYTIDGSDPTTSPTAVVYSGSINISATATLKYYAIDPAGNPELLNTGIYTISSPVISAIVAINGGAGATNNPAVTLGIAATGVANMQFSNDGVNYSPLEVYATSKAWTLDPGDGAKSVYIRFADAAGGLFAPVIAQITLDTTAPITAVTPIPGTYAPLSVTLTANEPATIHYTTDGTTPTTASTVYTVPILLAATTTIRYFAVDPAANAETVKSGTWTINIPKLTAGVMLNNGASATNNTAVTLSLSAATSNTNAGITGMQFSNDGITYSAEEAYATSKAWNLTAGDGLKTIYVKFTETGFTGTIVYPPVSANIVLDTVVSVTTAGPVPGIYSSPIPITLTANEPATFYYTTDGTTPTTTSTLYTGPIPLAATATITYLAVDTAGNVEAPKSGTWTIQAPNLVASVLINNGVTHTNLTSVTLNISATSSTGVTTMQFSSDGTNYTAEEPFATTRTWTLVPGDGLKTLYARFRDGSGGGGFLYPPVTAQITLDTALPVTTANPVTGAYSIAPVPVTLAANEPATIHYTTDGATPTNASPVYTGPIPVAVTTTIKYFAIDLAGNVEAVKSSTWSIHGADLVASVVINNGATATNNNDVNLTLNAFDPIGIDTMQFSNDGINFTAEEPYATSKAWTLAPGDGAKTVYVRFRDKTLPTGQLYPPVTAQIRLDTVAPVTAAGPVTGTYAVSPVSVTLTTSEPAIIYYTIDGTAPTTSSPVHAGPFSLSATTTIKYFAVDTAGNQEAVNSGTWTIHASDLVAGVKINNGAAATSNNSVTLTLYASDPVGIATMQFSNDGLVYSAEEPYATTKAWALVAGDGVKTVYVRFRDAALGGGYLYEPVTAQIVLDTVAPAATASPIPGTYSAVPVAVTLSANESATIHYTLDGSLPTTASSVYATPLLLSATTNIRYFAVDAAGNADVVKSGNWTIHIPDMVASVQINNNATVTNNANVNLTLSAIDPIGVDTMQFSNDGISYTAEEPYATGKTWALPSGDGLKTVYVRFRDKTLPTGNLYDPVTAGITLDTVAPVTTAGPITGTYSATPVMVTLSANETAAIYYTIDGSTPTAASPLCTGPIPVALTTTIKYFAVDTAGNVEAIKSGTWTIHASDMVASVRINSGAAITNSADVNLTLSATDPVGVATMQFSNNGVNFTAEEAYATGKAWTLSAGDGLKTVYVRFRDASLPSGVLYEPVIAGINLDTAPPVTTAGPVPGIYSTSPIAVILTANEPATIYYTTDASTPTTASSIYTAPIPVAATTIVKYFAVDTAGNAETVKSGTWTIHSTDLTASVLINSGATVTNSTSVTLTLSASDPAGIATMQFSNDGVSYTAEEAYAAGKVWTVTPGDGSKTVYVRFRDASLPSGFLYDPVTAGITLDTAPAVTTAGPIPGVYSGGPLSVTLTANEPATIYYTTDGSAPTVASAVYATPIPVAATTTVKYFAVDTAGNAETVKSGTWTIHTPDMVAGVKINSGATITNSTSVTLNLSADDSTGVANMQFSNDGISYSAEEPYATGKAWAITSGDGVKTVYVRFRDKSLPAGHLYDPVTAGITLDTVAPVTTAGPVTGTYSSGPVSVTLTANEPATIYYTIDGSTPTTASAVYTAPIPVTDIAAVSTTIKYFAVDTGGNSEAVKSGTWAIHAQDMVSSVKINNGAAITASTAVTLTLSAVDPLGVATMQFSNDGVNYSAEEPYAVTKTWTLTTGDGNKTIYVRFRDLSLPSGFLYEPVTASIAFAAKDGLYPGTTSYLASAVKAMQIANGLEIPTATDLAKCDVAPYANGASKADGKIDLLDVYAIMLRMVGLITTF